MFFPNEELQGERILEAKIILIIIIVYHSIDNVLPPCGSSSLTFSNWRGGHIAQAVIAIEEDLQGG